MRVIKENDTIEADEVIQILRKSPPVAHVYYDFSVGSKSVSFIMNKTVVRVENTKGISLFDPNRKVWSGDIPFPAISHAITKNGPKYNILSIVLKNNDRVTMEIMGSL